MSEDGRSHEYLDENVCSHDDTYVDSIKVKIQSKPTRHKHNSYNDLNDWQSHLANNGTEMFGLYVTVVCEKCGGSQEQPYSLPYIDAEWIE